MIDWRSLLRGLKFLRLRRMYCGLRGLTLRYLSRVWVELSARITYHNNLIAVLQGDGDRRGGYSALPSIYVELLLELDRCWVPVSKALEESTRRLQSHSAMTSTDTAAYSLN